MTIKHWLNSRKRLFCNLWCASKVIPYVFDELENMTVYPTHRYKNFTMRLSHPSGRYYPFGATVVPWGIHFSIFSQHATSCILVLFYKGEAHPFAEIPFAGLFEDLQTHQEIWCEFRIGNMFSMTLFELDSQKLDYQKLEYGFRMDGPGKSSIPGKVELHCFDPSRILLDPYAKSIAGRDVWGKTTYAPDSYPHRARIVGDDFDWGTDRPLEIPIEDLIIYEMHLRGFTRHPSSKVTSLPGTFAALQEKIPYFKALGVNCIELMPIFEFNELEYIRPNPLQEGEHLMNYWGYSTIGFFAPKSGYAAAGETQNGNLINNELKNLVKELHRQGIEIILDVVFNHTAEGNEDGPIISFKGIDNIVYYLLTPDGHYHNFSGTGNTLNCNHPIVRNMVLEALRHWVMEYHIDGFRFDLASILGRDPKGNPLENPPLLELLSFDPILGKCKLIAEAWDAGGLYQVGTFPAYNRWAEWNGKYRDDLRQFLKGDEKKVKAMAQRLQGSPDLYQGRGTVASINFVTCHDGFTLADLFSYQTKHNLANGEQNRDGANDNYSCNCSHEGLTDNPQINELRRRLMKNAIAILMISQGVPMILMGDEIGRTQQGNNNAYCHDNEQNWLNWQLLKKNKDLFRFTKNCITFRKQHPVLRNREHPRHQDYTGSGYADISWHGVKINQPDWADCSHSLAFLLCGHHAKGGNALDDYIYVAINLYWESLNFEIPELIQGMKWRLFVNTSLPFPKDSYEPGKELILADQHQITVAARSMVILVGR